MTTTVPQDGCFHRQGRNKLILSRVPVVAGCPAHVHWQRADGAEIIAHMTGTAACGYLPDRVRSEQELIGLPGIGEVLTLAGLELPAPLAPVWPAGHSLGPN
jgi:hypothetical protein